MNAPVLEESEYLLSFSQLGLGLSHLRRHLESLFNILCLQLQEGLHNETSRCIEDSDFDVSRKFLTDIPECIDDASFIAHVSRERFGFAACV